MKYYVDIPYPKISVEKQNTEYAKILSDIYAGNISELSNITLYIYEHIVLKNNYKEYSNVLKKIAIVEMHHLDILGELINLLGIKPVFMKYDEIKKGFIPWKASYLNYDIDIKNIIDLDIKSEKESIKHYKDALKLIKDKKIVEIINRLILDEELHLKIFEEYKKKYSE